MFDKLNELLLQSIHFSREYWEDYALLKAEDCISAFQSQDWTKMEDALPLLPEYWRLNCIEVLEQLPSERSLSLLALLCRDPNRQISQTAKRSLAKLARQSKPDDGYFEHLHQLNTEISALHKPHLFRFFYKKQPKKTAA